MVNDKSVNVNHWVWKCTRTDGQTWEHVLCVECTRTVYSTCKWDRIVRTVGDTWYVKNDINDKIFKNTNAIKRRNKGSNWEINEEDGIDQVINEDDDRNLHNIDNDVISDGASADTSSNSQESNRSSLVYYHSDDIIPLNLSCNWMTLIFMMK